MTITDETEDTAGAGARRIRLGVRDLLNRTGALTLRAPIIWTAIIGCVLLQIAVMALVIPMAVLLPGSGADGDGASTIIAFVIAVVMIVGFLLVAFLSTVLVHRAMRLSEGQPASLSEAIGAGARLILPAFLGTAIVFILVTLGSLVFIVPGLWVMGLYAVYLPVIVVEGRRRGVLARTRHLTRFYRWPLAGFLSVVYAVSFIVSIIVEFLAAAIGAGIGGQIVGIFLSSVVIGVTLAALTAAVTLAHQRLVEIKEGGMRPGLTAVFE